ncbi:hypothetical protein HYW44_00385 [Candidatus Daviesbacteria bacterium]|nr:hypothetical protein [Candidatus Daviesbacteria bacterium]
MSDRESRFLNGQHFTRRQLLQTASGLLLLSCQRKPEFSWEISFAKPEMPSTGSYRVIIDGGYFAKNPNYHHNYTKGDFRLNFLVQPLGPNLKLDAELGNPDQSTYMDGWTAILPNHNFNSSLMLMTRWSDWKFTELWVNAARYPLPAPTQAPSRRSI